MLLTTLNYIDNLYNSKYAPVRLHSNLLVESGKSFASGAFCFMKEIPLSRGLFALVDDDDFDFINQWKWYAKPHRKTHYAVREKQCNYNKTLIWMHREILGLSGQNVVIDHKDRNGINNQKDNLRLCSTSQNCANRGSKKNTSSKYRGVQWHKIMMKWSVQLRKKGILYNCGYYSSEEEAAIVYNKKAIELHGEFAYLNIIENESHRHY